MKVQVRGLYEFPYGSIIEYEWKEYFYIDRDEDGYVFFDGYRIILEEELFDGEETVFVHRFNFNKREYINALYAYLLILEEDPYIHKNTIKRITERIERLRGGYDVEEDL